VNLNGSLVDQLTPYAEVYAGCRVQQLSTTYTLDRLGINPSGVCDGITVTYALFRGTGVNPFPDANAAAVRYSTDHGAHWSGRLAVGTELTEPAGFDAIKVGSTSLAAALGNVKVATTLGGTYSNFAGAAVTAVTIGIPYRKFSGTTKNYSTSTPDALIGTATTLYKVVAGMATDITPAGAVPLGPNSAGFSQFSGLRFAVLLSVSGTTHLYTTTNGGTSFTDRGAVSGALYVRMRKGDKNGKQLFVSGGATLKYSKDFGATLVNRQKPVAGGLLGIEVYS
jgi:hypothetical protein